MFYQSLLTFSLLLLGQPRFTSAALCNNDVCFQRVEQGRKPKGIGACHAALATTIVPAAVTKTVTSTEVRFFTRTTRTTTSTTVETTTTMTAVDTTTSTSTTFTTTTTLPTAGPSRKVKRAAKAKPSTISQTTVPKYATAQCSDFSQFTSACSCAGVRATTITAATPTITKTKSKISLTLTITTSVSTDVSTSVSTSTEQDSTTTTTTTASAIATQSPFALEIATDTSGQNQGTYPGSAAPEGYNKIGFYFYSGNANPFTLNENGNLIYAGKAYNSVGVAPGNIAVVDLNTRVVSFAPAGSANAIVCSTGASAAFTCTAPDGGSTLYYTYPSGESYVLNIGDASDAASNGMGVLTFEVVDL